VQKIESVSKIVYVAVRRMDIYEQALGLTMLRLYVRLFSL
jgi:hypothetical protein